MNAFEKIIGHESIKNTLNPVCDMLRNPEKYRSRGIRAPRGILMYGDPGLGKTLTATSFIEASGLPALTVRKTMGGDAFINLITETFEKARAQAPCIVFLDDMDKFANEDKSHRNAPEYVAVQAGIDASRDAEVLVIATANDIDDLPDSLIRQGRFDLHLEFEPLEGDDAEKLIGCYLRDKEISDDLNMEDVSKMVSFSSCAELESLLNKAMIHSIFAGKDALDIEDFVDAMTDWSETQETIRCEDRDGEQAIISMHEAGHLVVSEVLMPGSVGFACVREADGSRGYIHTCRKIQRRPHNVMIGLGGKAAAELAYPERAASGCEEDLQRAAGLVSAGLRRNATGGFDKLCAAHSGTEALGERVEIAAANELERYMRRTRAILIRNSALLEAAVDLLCRKGYLLRSDIDALEQEHPLVMVEAE